MEDKQLMLDDQSFKCFLVSFVEVLGDELGIEFRSGTDRKGKAYQTNKVARAKLFDLLRIEQVRDGIRGLASEYRAEGRLQLQIEMRELLGVKQDEEPRKKNMD